LNEIVDFVLLVKLRDSQASKENEEKIFCLKKLSGENMKSIKPNLKDSLIYS